MDAVFAFLSSVVWAGVAVYAIRRVDAALTRWHAVSSSVPATSSAPVITIPDDLLAYAGSMSELWAVEDTTRVIRERYEELQDWNRVRRAMGIGILEEQTR